MKEVGLEWQGAEECSRDGTWVGRGKRNEWKLR